PQEAPQQKFLGTAKVRHVRRTLGPAQHGSKGDKQEFHQIVAGVVRPRIGQTSENLLEFAHVTPLEKWESPSESTFAADAIPVPNPYAIPLPSRGRGTAWHRLISDRPSPMRVAVKITRSARPAGRSR